MGTGIAKEALRGIAAGITLRGDIIPAASKMVVAGVHPRPQPYRWQQQVLGSLGGLVLVPSFGEVSRAGLVLGVIEEQGFKNQWGHDITSEVTSRPVV